MIGILTDESEIAVIEEFFQLFKTPWERFREGVSYDIVISSLSRIPDLDARLTLLYSSELGPWDTRHGLALAGSFTNKFVQFDDLEVPIYGRLATFTGKFMSVGSIAGSSQTTALIMRTAGRTTIRLGFDLFREVAFLLSTGQPKENAMIPTCDLHIALLRNWILQEGIPLCEIPPVRPGYHFATCLTHDVDFLRIRDHWFDHSFWGFLYRATILSVRDLLRRRISGKALLRNLQAVVSLPFVYLGLAKDFWLPFERYLEIERDLPATFFLIPFKHRAGAKLNGRHYRKRATKYDITDLLEWVEVLLEQDKEIAVHGIDAWHSAESGREELDRIAASCRSRNLGVRIHWLCFDHQTFQNLEQAGFHYDSTFGYNDAVGCRAGTTQVFRPIGAHELLELPLVIQDTAMFFSREMNLSNRQAWKRCKALIENAHRTGGVLTVLWHERSLAPERLWDDFYLRLLAELKTAGSWFGSAREVIQWFRKRRNLVFKNVSLTDNEVHVEVEAGDTSDLVFRMHLPRSYQSTRSNDELGYIDVPLNGRKQLDFLLFER